MDESVNIKTFFIPIVSRRPYKQFAYAGADCLVDGKKYGVVHKYEESDPVTPGDAMDFAKQYLLESLMVGGVIGDPNQGM